MRCVAVNSRDVEACHRLNQKANPKKVIIKLSKRKDATRVMNNKKKLKSMKPQNIGLPSGCKIYINESLCKYYTYLWWKCKLLQTRDFDLLCDKWVNKNDVSKQ